MEHVYQVLVVDDSAVMRKHVSAMIEKSSYLSVIGIARNGKDAIEKIGRLKPDVVILDTIMPEMNGLEALEYIMENCPVPVVMMSEGEEATIEAMAKGAIDFVVKDELLLGELDVSFHERLLVAANAKIIKPPSVPIKEVVIQEEKIESKRDLLIIGSSTGGPAALQQILTRFPANFPVPIIVIQHMPEGFTKSLADRLNDLCALRVKEVVHGERMEVGTIYIGVSGFQTLVLQDAAGHYVFQITQRTPFDTLYKPSVDVTLSSVAKLRNLRTVVVILTGMGVDGLRGCQLMKENDCVILSESAETCVVYGMPKAVFEAGLSDQQVPLYNMYEQILLLI